MATTYNRKPAPAALSQLITSAREAKNLSKRELAERIGKSHTFIWAIEGGRLGQPLTDPDTIRTLAAALDLTTDQIYAAADRIPDDIERALTALDAPGLGAVRSFLATRPGRE